ncbi:hypothetical protein [Microcoleus sp. FACHB-68]|uniref:hypothetical protein n=1 Tax=Microcoleus sp. FACHB-68 TaxID=2692826 RepID=UPI0016866AFC|nr:hypothetical protein [Microcoleus sp. FACHB-68]
MTGKLRLLHISSIMIVLTNGAPIPFTTISYSNFARSSELETVWLSFFAIILFILISFIFQSQSFYKNKNQEKNYPYNYKRKKKYANLWFWLFLGIGVFSVLRFMLFSGGVSFMGSIFSSMGNLAQYYETRLEIGDALVVAGKGLGWATISTNYLLPTILFTSVYYAANRKLSKKPQIIYWITFSIALALIAVLSITFAHRFMFFYVFLLIIMAVFIYKYKGNLELYFLHWKKPYLVISIFLAIIGTGGLLFSAISGGGLLEGVGLLLDRALIVPAGTSSYYYYLFPRAFPYRGILEAFQMYGIAQNGDIGFYDVGEAMTGLRFGANASFLAIGFSGAGLLGVLLVSLAYCIIASSADRLLNNVEPRLRFISILINFYGIISLISNPLYGSIVSFGFGISSFILYLIIKRGKRNHSQQQGYGF